MPPAGHKPTGHAAFSAGRVLGAIGEGLAEISLSRDASEVSLGWGGDAANVCVMAARLGVPARLLGRVGRDAFGRGMTAFWRSNGVDVRWILEDAVGPTGMYLNEPADDETHRFVYHRHASAGSRLTPHDLGDSFIDGLGVLVVTGVTLAVSRSSATAAQVATASARAHGTRIACVLNHRPALGGDLGELAELAVSSDILIASREDLVHVFGSAEPAAIRAHSSRLLEFVVTAGAETAVVTTCGRAFTQAVPPALARNAAGAGDALAGAYLAARLRGETPASSLAWGVAAATLSVGREGCATAYPTAIETAALLAVMPTAEPQ